jgi:hypothetical protein
MSAVVPLRIAGFPVLYTKFKVSVTQNYNLSFFLTLKLGLTHSVNDINRQCWEKELETEIRTKKGTVSGDWNRTSIHSHVKQDEFFPLNN